MQIAYFDESGIDGAHDITVISGVIAKLDDWPAITAEWRHQLEADGIPQFHYVDCKNQTKQYVGWDWSTQCQRHLDRLATLFTSYPVGGISAGFIGNWKRGVAERPDLQIRFPSAYSFCFEMMVKKIRDEMHHHGQADIVLVFSKQRTYEKRAIEIWQWHRDRGHWPEIKDVSYREPAKVMGLQMADMLAWETGRHLFKGGAHWRELPLLSRLVSKQEAVGNALYEIAYREENMESIQRLDGS